MTDAGLCPGCTHVRVIENRRGARFLMCGLQRTDPRFPKYPRLPVLHCSGFRPLDSPAGTTDPDMA
jgi:hypothetical protein